MILESILGCPNCLTGIAVLESVGRFRIGGNTDQELDTLSKIESMKDAKKVSASASRLLILQERRSSRGGGIRSDDTRLAKSLTEQSSDDVMYKQVHKVTKLQECICLRTVPSPEGLNDTRCRASVRYNKQMTVPSSKVPPGPGGGKKPPQDQKGVWEIAELGKKIYRLVQFKTISVDTMVATCVSRTSREKINKVIMIWGHAAYYCATEVKTGDSTR